MHQELPLQIVVVTGAHQQLLREANDVVPRSMHQDRPLLINVRISVHPRLPWPVNTIAPAVYQELRGGLCLCVKRTLETSASG
jgi:hypothetical protein